MKKIIVLVLCATLFLFVSCVAGCETEATSCADTAVTMPAHPQDDPNMNPELADEIRRAYIKTQIVDVLLAQADDVYIQDYVGTYNGGIVVWISHDGKQVSHMNGSETIGEYTVHYGNSARPMYYLKGCFYSLSSAYDAELISPQDAYDIGCKLNSDFTERYPVAP